MNALTPASRPLKLRAEILIDIDAADYVQAAARQAELDRAIANLQTLFGSVEVSLRPRRERAQAVVRTLADPPQAGRVNTYIPRR
jgi:hypothetical protein